MKLKAKKSQEIFVVYGLYWHDNKTYFCCFPKNSKGLSAYREEEVEIVDPAIAEDFEFIVTANRLSGIFHKLLLSELLLDRLFESDPAAYERFFELLGRRPN